MNQKNLRWADGIDFIGLMSIGLYILLCSIFASGFAVLHVTLPFGLPVFVSEICLFLNLILLIIKCVITKGWRPWHGLWLAFAVWIIWSTLCGIQNGTFLALRHAAMFLYIFFALLGYSFYNRRIINNPLVHWPLLVLMLLLIIFRFLNYYYFFSFMILALVLVFRIPSRPARWILTALLFLSYFHCLFCGSRSHLVGNVTAIFFISAILIFVIFDWKLRYRLMVFTGLLILAGLGVKHFSDPNAVKSLTMPAELRQLYHHYQDYVDARKNAYVTPSIPVKLYDDNADDRKIRSRTSNLMPFSPVAARHDQSNPVVIHPDKSSPAHPVVPIIDQNEPRSLGNVYGNILFRWFIWEDMRDDLIQAHSLWGVGFGKPQRSRSLEILNWGSTEWSRDGWITPHNSFYHFVYRGGIMGILIIAGIVMAIAHMVKIFIARRSIAGILLLSVLFYWIAMANFLVILELPYNAVLFWMLFGMIFAYAQGRNNDETC